MRYIRIRCQYYRTVVQRPLTGGLQWFIRFYDRLGTLRTPINSILPEASYHVAGEGHRIRALEFRTSIYDTEIEIGELVLGYLKSWQRVLEKNCGSMVEPEMGIVFHFVKGRHSKGMAFKNRAPAAFWADTYSEPLSSEKDVEPGRYVSYFVEQSRKVRALTELIVAMPSLLWVIRGLDVANDELGVPTWVLVPLFRHVLDESARSLSEN